MLTDFSPKSRRSRGQKGCQQRDEARRLGLSGWARNRTDGSVEILAEGDPAAIDRLVAWCREGPPLARVRSVERSVEAIPPGAETELGSDFEIR